VAEATATQGTAVCSGPLTVGQTGFARAHFAVADPASLNVALRIDLTGPLDPQALARALTLLVARHAALRTRIRRRGTEFVQEVCPEWTVRLPVEEFGAVSGGQPDDAVSAWCLAAAREPFDLTTGPLARFALARVTDNQWVLAFIQHHIVTDGMSQGILLADLRELYSGVVDGRDPALPPLSAQPLDFARWQRKTIRGEREASALRYWADYLDGADFSLVLPGAGESPGRGAVDELDAGADLAAGLHAFARSIGCTPFAVLLAVFGTTLCEWAGRDEVLVCTTFANRTQRDFGRVPGAFANTVPVRLRAAAGRSVAELARDTMRHLLRHAAHQELPFPVLLERLDVAKRAGGARFPFVWFVMNPGAERSHWRPDLRAHPRMIVRPGPRGDLSVLPTLRTDEFRLLVDCSTDVAAPAVVRTEVERYLAALRAVTETSC
jgi:hypothetical protein